MHQTGSKGDIGVAMATADLIEKGFDILAPICANSPFDLVIYRDGKFHRVQVKYRTPINGVMDVSCRRSIVSNRKISHKTNEEVDIVCAYNPETKKCHYMKAEESVRASLRVIPTSNGQKKNVRYADDYLEVPI